MAASSAHAAAIARAIKASGTILRVEPDDFQRLVGRAEDPLVVVAFSRFFGQRYEYLSGYKGLVLYTKTKSPLVLPGRAEVITARSIWIP